jgi:hypothetical protein
MQRASFCVRGPRQEVARATSRVERAVLRGEGGCSYFRAAPELCRLVRPERGESPFC